VAHIKIHWEWVPFNDILPNCCQSIVTVRWEEIINDSYRVLPRINTNSVSSFKENTTDDKHFYHKNKLIFKTAMASGECFYGV